MTYNFFVIKLQRKFIKNANFKLGCVEAIVNKHMYIINIASLQQFIINILIIININSLTDRYTLAKYALSAIPKKININCSY